MFKRKIEQASEVSEDGRIITEAGVYIIFKNHFLIIFFSPENRCVCAEGHFLRGLGRGG